MDILYIIISTIIYIIYYKKYTINYNKSIRRYRV